MNPERWEQIKKLFLEALDLDREHRAAYLDEVCSGDASLRTEVENLLANHEEAGDFLEQPIREAAADLLYDDSVADLIGHALGPYKITGKLGQGGMGIVYLAEDMRLGRSVAIKALASRHTQDRQHRERLRREARVAATLAHPAIATVYSLEEFDGNLYIICEYVRGSTLFEDLKKGPLPLPLLLDTVIEIARAMAAAHERGVIHRDLKPENVMRTPEGAIKVLDFGLARFQESRSQDASLPSRLTGAGAFLGTPAYASPEQLLGLEVDFRTDIFSFGVLIYELASGLHPFAGSDSITTIARILEAEPAALASIRPLVPPPLDVIVRRCLRKTPGQRYAATRELVAALVQLKQDLAGNAALQGLAQASAMSAPPPPTSRPLWWWQFHQAVIGGLYYSMLYPMWQVKVWTPGMWGRLIFFLTVAAVAVAANLRFHLWFTSAYYPSELSKQRRLVARWIRAADVLFVLLLMAAAATIYSEHEVITTLLVAVAIGCLGAFLLIEPTTSRAAFESSTALQRDPPQALP